MAWHGAACLLVGVCSVPPGLNSCKAGGAHARPTGLLMAPPSMLLSVMACQVPETKFYRVLFSRSKACHHLCGCGEALQVLICIVASTHGSACPRDVFACLLLLVALPGWPHAAQRACPAYCSAQCWCCCSCPGPSHGCRWWPHACIGLSAVQGDCAFWLCLLDDSQEGQVACYVHACAIHTVCMWLCLFCGCCVFSCVTCVRALQCRQGRLQSLLHGCSGPQAGPSWQTGS
jgi:hypothetical protein